MHICIQPFNHLNSFNHLHNFDIQFTTVSLQCLRWRSPHRSQHWIFDGSRRSLRYSVVFWQIEMQRNWNSTCPNLALKLAKVVMFGYTQSDWAQLCCRSCSLWQNWRHARHGWWHGTANERRDYAERIDVHIDRSKTHTNGQPAKMWSQKHVCHFIQDFLETHLLPLGLANMLSLYLHAWYVRFSYVFVPWPLDAGSPTSSPVRALAP